MARLTVIVGGGGVGKTTASAALAMALARKGRRTLVVTVDPARRLADALGTEVGDEATPVEVDGASFVARMPDARASVGTFARWLFADEPAALERFLANPLYLELGDALVGMHELVCVAIVDQELRSGNFDEVVLDTAPSRHALEFLDYPAKLEDMLEARSLRYVSALAGYAGASLGSRPRVGSLLSWGKQRIQSLMGMVIGSAALMDVAALFTDLIAVRGRWVEVLRSVQHRIADRETRYLVVSGGSGASVDDAEYLLAELRRRQLEPSAVLINRVVSEVPDWLLSLDASDDATLDDLVASYRLEYDARVQQTERARERLSSVLGAGRPLRVLPGLRTTDPHAILLALAAAMGQLEGDLG